MSRGCGDWTRSSIISDLRPRSSRGCGSLGWTKTEPRASIGLRFRLGNGARVGYVAMRRNERRHRDQSARALRCLSRDIDDKAENSMTEKGSNAPDRTQADGVTAADAVSTTQGVSAAPATSPFTPSASVAAKPLPAAQPKKKESSPAPRTETDPGIEPVDPEFVPPQHMRSRLLLRLFLIVVFIAAFAGAGEWLIRSAFVRPGLSGATSIPSPRPAIGDDAALR